MYSGELKHKHTNTRLLSRAREDNDQTKKMSKKKATNSDGKAHAERQKREMDAMMTLLRKEENLIYNIFPLSAKRDEHRLMNSAHIGVEVR